ncbi:DNA topoisomerase, partial [Streptomyces sp. UMAF16]|nr:DNA topoisomerase [Streptomyces sp. UMAF16]
LLKLTPENNIEKNIITEITGAEKGKLFPTDLGILVTDFLKQHFQKIMDYGFTAKIEENFDEIAEGKIQWNKMIDNFYQPFHVDIEHTL